jgi:hypothetical protein
MVQFISVEAVKGIQKRRINIVRQPYRIKNCSCRGLSSKGKLESDYSDLRVVFRRSLDFLDHLLAQSPVCCRKISIVPNFR